MANLGPNITPPPSPPGVCIAHNMWLASNRTGKVLGPWDLAWFYRQVEAAGPWNYKKRVSSEYEDFGNFNYGAAGTAMGLPEIFLLRAAGWAQTKAGTSAQEYGNWYASVPYGDDPRDQFQIKRGIKYALQQGY